MNLNDFEEKTKELCIYRYVDEIINIYTNHYRSYEEYKNNVIKESERIQKSNEKCFRQNKTYFIYQPLPLILSQNVFDYITKRKELEDE